MIQDLPFLPDVEAEVLIVEELTSSKEYDINNQYVKQEQQQNMEEEISFFKDLNKEDISDDEDDNQEPQKFFNDIEEIGSFLENISIQLNSS